MAARNYPSHVAEDQSPLPEKVKAKLRKSRFFSVSLLLHLLLVASLGKIVFSPPDDPVGPIQSGERLVNDDAQDVAIQPPEIPQLKHTAPPKSAAANPPSNPLDLISVL